MDFGFERLCEALARFYVGRVGGGGLGWGPEGLFPRVCSFRWDVCNFSSTSTGSAWFVLMHLQGCGVDGLEKEAW